MYAITVCAFFQRILHSLILGRKCLRLKTVFLSEGNDPVHMVDPYCVNFLCVIVFFHRYPLLESDVLTFFAAIPDTSPARYNKPFQNINAFLNWALEQELIGKNPIKVHKLHKRRDDGNIKPLPVDKLQAFLASLDKSTYTGLRDYVICMQCSSTKESRRRSVWQSLMPSLSA